MFMKKLICVLTLLLLASTAMADVTISCSSSGKTVTVSYTATENANKPRALGLDITVDGDGTIGNVVPLSQKFWVFPGTNGLNIADLNFPSGTPVGDPCQAPSDTELGVGSNGITVEMGSLHYPPEVNSVNAPGLGPIDLVSFDVSCTNDVNVTIAGNAIRGKVVNYAASAATVAEVSSGIYATCTVDATCVGNVKNDDSIVNPQDITALVQLLVANKTQEWDPIFEEWIDIYEINPEDDAWMDEANVKDDDSVINPQDITALVQYLVANKTQEWDPIFEEWIDIYEISCD